MGDPNRIDGDGNPVRLSKETKRGCRVAFCRNKRARGRQFCHACSRLMYARRHPQRAYYQNLRRHAKERGLVFSLTWERFVEITSDFDWGQYKLSHGERMSIDRVDVARGYEDDNVQVMTVSENCMKQNRVDYKARREGWYPEESDVPF